MDLDEKVCSRNPFNPCLHTYAVKFYTFNQIYTYFIHFPWIYIQTELSWQFACKPLKSQLEPQPLLSRRIQKQISNQPNNKTLLDISLLLIYWKHAFYFLIATIFYEFGTLQIRFGFACSFPFFFQFEPILSIEWHGRLQSTRFFSSCFLTFGFHFYDFSAVLNICGSIIVWQWCSHGAHKQAYLHSAWYLLKITIHAAAK